MITHGQLIKAVRFKSQAGTKEVFEVSQRVTIRTSPGTLGAVGVWLVLDKHCSVSATFKLHVFLSPTEQTG